MIRQVPPKHPSPEFMGLRSVAVLILTLAVPAGLTLHSVRVARPLMAHEGNPSPYGYTVSLGLFALPVAVLACWFLNHPDKRFQKQAFLRTLAFLIPAGIGLDLLWGNTFFQFPNRKAVLGVPIPAWGGPVPVEEFGFYALGFLAVLMTYIWCDEYWLGMYNVSRDGYERRAARIPRVVQFYRPAPLIGLVLGGVACWYKWQFSAFPAGWPGYALFLIGVALVPTMFLYTAAEPFINWRALSFTYVLLVLISLLWEATVAVPYQWWIYREEAMVGVFIGAWSRLPIEEPCLWSVVTFATIIWYEAMKVFLAMDDRSTRRALFGRSTSGPAAPGPSESEAIRIGSQPRRGGIM